MDRTIAVLYIVYILQYIFGSATVCRVESPLQYVKVSYHVRLFLSMGGAVGYRAEGTVDGRNRVAIIPLAEVAIISKTLSTIGEAHDSFL